MTLHVQFLTMVSMCVGGFYLGIARDTFRRFSPYWNHRPLLIYIFEVTFWALQTSILFYVLYQVNAGELRIYIFVACLLGFAIYQVMAATLYKKMLEWIIDVVTNVYRYLKKIIYLLVIAPIKWICYIVLQILQFIILLALLMIKLILTPIKWLIQLGYYLLPKIIQKNIRKLTEVYSIIKDTIIKSIKNILFKER